MQECNSTETKAKAVRPDCQWFETGNAVFSCCQLFSAPIPGAPEDAEATEIVDFSGDGGPVVRDKK
jgi:hypothetical protein